MLNYREQLRNEEAVKLKNVEQGRKLVTEAQNRLDAVTANFEEQELQLKAIQDEIVKLDEFEAFKAQTSNTKTPKKAVKETPVSEEK